MAQGLVADKVALVTGAGGGIGRASAEAFAREGARGVLVVDLREEGGEETVERVRLHGSDARFLRADVTNEADVERMVATAVEHWGRLDCAHNNAGTGDPPRPFVDLALTEFNRVLTVNLVGVFLCMKHELRQMLAQDPKGGAIVNTASTAGIVAFPATAHYVASKHGVLGLTKTAAQEHARDDIRVNAICPGATDTPLLQGFIGGDATIEAALKAGTPQGELGRPDWQAQAAVWLCSERAAWVNGESMLVDGGMICR
jgi:NAD(P)-dependent dehydrogenase (short-subunit alcohol dehydrogenase family)